MRPDKLTIHELFQRERRYVVPLYQRAYVWELQDQWEPLWDDIERQAEACLEAENHVSHRSHFLGAIVLNVSRIVGAGVARSEIIDGQQRLTTLQIVIAALRDYATTLESTSARVLQRLTSNEDEKHGSDASFKVWPTNADRDIFRLVMTAGSPESLQGMLRITDEANLPRMVSAYLFFYNHIKDFVEYKGPDQDAREHRIFGLRQALRTSLQLVVIELEDGDDPQVIFETLNARGQPLLPSDLIRNFIFLQAANDPASDPDELYDHFWRHFDDKRLDSSINGEDRFWHVAERQGRLTRPRIDLFLFHYLTMQIENDLNIGQLFREFRDWQTTRPMSNEALLKDLKRYSAIFSQLIAPAGNDRVSVLAQRLRSLDTSTVYPVLLYIIGLKEDRLSLRQRDQILEDIESWMVRRLVCQLTNKNYNRFFVSLLSKLKKAGHDVDLAAMVWDELGRSREDTARWPNNSEFLVSWLNKPIYAKTRPDRSAMILRAIESNLRTSKNELISLPSKLSVEHLLPQKGGLADYPYSSSILSDSGDDPERARSRLRDTIGNLTLLTGELNASASNGPWLKKVAKIVADSDLRLNAWLRNDAPATWDDQSVMLRGQQLFQYAKEIWPSQLESDIGDTEFVVDDIGEKRQWHPFDKVALQQKRDALIASLSFREDQPFYSESTAKYRNSIGTVRSVVSVSKLYPDRPEFPYWYSFFDHWETYLEEAKAGFFVLGCTDRDVGFAIPFCDLKPLLSGLNTTTRQSSGQMYWHIHLVETGAGLAIWLPKADKKIDVERYQLPIIS